VELQEVREWGVGAFSHVQPLSVGRLVKRPPGNGGACEKLGRKKITV